MRYEYLKKFNISNKKFIKLVKQDIFTCVAGGDIFHSPIAESLPTLPFDVLRKLYDSTPLSTDDGRLLRRISINTATVHLLLVCLGIFTHQTEVGAGGGEKEKDGATKEEVKGKDDKSQLYWAKGMKQTLLFFVVVIAMF